MGKTKPDKPAIGGQGVELLWAIRYRVDNTGKKGCPPYHVHPKLWQLDYVISGEFLCRCDTRAYPVPPAMTPPRRAGPNWQFCSLKDSAARKKKRQAFRLKGGVAMLIPPGWAHITERCDVAEKYSFKFTHPSARDLIQSPLRIIPDQKEKEHILALCDRLIGEHHCYVPVHKKIIASLLDQLLLLLKRSHERLSRRSPSQVGMDARERVRRIGEMLRLRYAERFSIGELAKRACLSRRHMFKLFREEFGSTPVVFHTKVRMEKAVEMSRHSHLTWDEIARHLGYDDPAYFSRAFKRTMGTCPSRFLLD